MKYRALRSCSLNAKSGKQATDENKQRKVHALAWISKLLIYLLGTPDARIQSKQN